MTAAPLTIIVDNREQIPLEFSSAVNVERGTLQASDYSVKGLEDLIGLERKTLPDLLGTITTGRERFIKELRALRRFRFAALLIECNWESILNKEYLAQVHPNAVIGSLLSFSIKYGVVPILASDHRIAGELAERLLLNFVRIIEADYKRATAARAAAPEGRE